MESTIPATRARVRLGELMRRAAENNERFIIERDGSPQVMVLSVTDYENLQEAACENREDSLRRAREFRGRVQARIKSKREITPAERVLAEGRETRNGGLTGLR